MTTFYIIYFIHSYFLKMILMREEGEGWGGGGRGGGGWGGGGQRICRVVGTGDENCVFYCPVIWGI